MAFIFFYSVNYHIFTFIYFDLNEPLIEEDGDAPFVGQNFESQQEAYTSITTMQEKMGLLWKIVLTPNMEVLLDKILFAIVRGNRAQRWLTCLKLKVSSKCDCRAHMRITLKRCFDIFPKEGHVTIFIKEHNYHMLSLWRIVFYSDK